MRHSFSITKEIAGKKWLKCFYRRHPNIAKRRSQKLNPARAQKVNHEIVNDYFEKLKATLLENQLHGKPGQIYNMDEKGCQLTLHHQQTVLAHKGVKRVHFVAPEHGENVSVVACANALGQSIPPLIIFKGVRIKPEWYITLPSESKILMTKRGSMTTDAFIQWLDHFARFKSPGPVLSIFDGASSHLDIRIVEAADKHNVTLFCLPSNSTHELQPLDKAVFRSFEAYWDEEVLNFWINHPNERAITRARFGEIFTPVWLKSMSSENILSAFRATGIWPFNPKAIPDSAFAPSALTHRKLIDQVLEINAEKNVQQSSNVENESIAGPSGLTFTKNKSDKIFKITSDSDSDSSGSYTSNVSSDEIEEELEDIEHLEEEKSPHQKEKQAATLNGSKNTETTSVNLDVSFTESGFFTTPDFKVSVKKRRPAINSRAQKVTKILFSGAEKSVTPTNKRKNKETKKDLIDEKNQESIPKGKKKKCEKRESWYCYVCDEDRIADMRRCSVCLSYIHEDCVGLSKEDKEVFVCPKCN